jgi:Tol biopolymer transport system component
MALKNGGRYMALVVGTAGSDSLVGSSGDDVLVGDPQRAAVFTILSTSVTGIVGNFGSLQPAISPDGVNFAFVSQSNNLIAGDSNFDYSIYLKNIETGVVTKVSTSAAGVAAGGASDSPQFTPDGQKVIFTSAGANLVAGDINGKIDLFMKDLATGLVTCLSTNSSGQFSNGEISVFDISADGTRIVFASDASNLVAGDINGYSDIFVKDLTTGLVTRVSTDASGAEANLISRAPKFSPDGNSVVFSSFATNLTPGDTPGSDIFVKNLITGVVTKISTSATGVGGNGTSEAPTVSPDGTRIVFSSGATNLLDGQTLSNGIRLFMKNLNTGIVTLVSTDSAGQDLGGFLSSGGEFSPDGQSIMITNTSSAGVGQPSVTRSYVKDLMTGQLTDIAILAGLPAGTPTYGFEFSPTGAGFSFYAYTNNISQSYYFSKQELGSAADSFNGGTGTDTVSYQSALQSITLNLTDSSGLSNVGDAFGDTFTSIEKFVLSKFNDTFVGSNVADTVDGSLGNDTLGGGDGNDTLNGGAGGDTLNGGAGVDTASWAGGAAVTVDLGATATYGYSSEGDILLSIENLVGSANADIILGDGRDNRIDGGLGGDTIKGQGGIDTLTYESKGAAIIVDLAAAATYGYSSEGDIILGIENLVGTSAADILLGDGLNNLLEGGDGGDTLNGRGGIDTATFASSATAITVDLAAAPTYGYTTQGDILIAIENLIGSSNNDILLGDGQNNLFEAGTGADYVNGRGGIDTVTYANATTSITVDLGAAPTYGYTNEGDTLIGIENVVGSSLGDTLLGDGLANTLSGGLGNDLLRGQGGADTFRFDSLLGATNIDTIVDFTVIDDTIQLENEIFTGLAVGTIAAANLSLTGSATTASAQIIYNSATGTLAYDADGTGAASTAITFASIGAGKLLTLSDFDVT